MRTDVTRIGLVLALAAGMTLCGCGGRQIHIQGLGDIRKQNVRIDVVGVNWAERQQWEKMTMQEYWREGNQRREDSVSQGYNHPVKFEPASPCEVVIKEKDGVWKKGREKGATHFFVMFDTCTHADAWRICLPLSPKCWRGRLSKDTIEVAIQPSGVVSKTTPSSKAGCQ